MMSRISPAKQIADEHYRISTTDVDAVSEFIREKHIDGVFVGFVDLLLPYYAEICQKYRTAVLWDKSPI